MTATLVRFWLAALLVFAIWPGLDLWVSGLFYSRAQGAFPLAASGGLELLRDVIWNAANLLTLACLLFGLQALLVTRPTAVPGRFWGYALLLIFLGPILIVNVILKGYWGRARPADTDVFGGPLPFTPPWEIAGNCASNCSFVSGEAAAVTCVAIILGVFLWQNVENKRRLIWALFALVVIGASLRVLKGRHYLSDVTWSVLLMVTLHAALARGLGLEHMRDRLTFRALGADAGRLFRTLTVWRSRP